MYTHGNVLKWLKARHLNGKIYVSVGVARKLNVIAGVARLGKSTLHIDYYSGYIYYIAHSSPKAALSTYLQ